LTSEAHIVPLLALLDDPDSFVRSSVRDRFLEIGPSAAPALREAFEHATDGSTRQAAESILQALGVRGFTRAFDDVLGAAQGNDDIDLEQGVLAVAYLGWPEYAPDDVAQQLDTMASMIEERARRCDNGYMIVREMNRYLIDQLGFRGCRQDKSEYYDAEHAYINRILERRTANPVGLSTVYLLLARRLRFPLFGVGFPSHFLLKYRSLGEEFFVDPFNGGQILSHVDCRRFLLDLNIEYRPSYLDAVNNRRIVARIMRNLTEVVRPAGSLLADTLESAIDRLLDEEAWGGRATERQRPSI